MKKPPQKLNEIVDKVLKYKPKKGEFNMSVRIDHEVTLPEVAKMAEKTGMIYYGALTPWWSAELPGYRTGGVPCDPRGGVLFETDSPDGFLHTARTSVMHYGKHGLRAFLLAYHGCVVVDGGEKDGYPTCLKNWDEYNNLIDKTYSL